MLCGIAGKATDDTINTSNAEHQICYKDATKFFITKAKNVFRVPFLGHLIEHDNNVLFMSEPHQINLMNILYSTNIG